MIIKIFSRIFMENQGLVWNELTHSTGLQGGIYCWMTVLLITCFNGLGQWFFIAWHVLLEIPWAVDWPSLSHFVTKAYRVWCGNPEGTDSEPANLVIEIGWIGDVWAATGRWRAKVGTSLLNRSGYSSSFGDTWIMATNSWFWGLCGRHRAMITSQKTEKICMICGCIIKADQQLYNRLP